MITDDKLAELEAAERALRPVEWIQRGDCIEEKNTHGFRLQITGIVAQFQNVLTFIALARNHMRSLLDEVRAHREVAKAVGDRGGGLHSVGVELLRLRDAPLKEENEKLRAELKAAREALADAYETLPHGRCRDREVGPALKKIDDSGLLREGK